MLTANQFPAAPVIVRDAFAGGYTANGTFVITLDELESYSNGTGRGAERVHKCPACGDSERAFHVNIETGVFNCKRASCAVKGLLFERWAAPNPTRFRGRNRVRDAFALAPLKQSAPLDAATIDGGNWREQWEKSVPLDEADAEPARRFLTGRGLSVEIAHQSGARFSRNWAPSPEGKIYRGGAAVLFPLRNIAGKLVAVCGRYLARGADPKARIGGRAESGVFFCSANELSPLDSENVVAVEGPADALALASIGVPSLAFCGTVAPHWIARACGLRTFWAALDNDNGGDKGAAAALDAVNGYARKSIRLTPTGANDWAELLEISGADALRATIPLELLGDVVTATPDDLPAIDYTPKSAIEAATAILDAAYFNLARGGVWCIGWQQPSRAAWQWAAIANGGTLDTATGLPSMEAAAAIDWANAQKETK